MTSPTHAYSDGHGLRRYNVEGLDPHPISVTTLIKTIAPGTNLSTWVDKRLIESAIECYAKTNDAELALQVGKQARWGGSEAADFGTSVHTLTERADLRTQGKNVADTMVPDQKRVQGYVSQWEKARDAFDMQILAIECTLVNRELGYAGTADRIAIVPALSQDPLVLDIKSGKNIYPDVALQCAALAHCPEILYDDGSLHPVPWELSQRYGVAAHVRARSAKLIPLNIYKAWPLFQPLPQLAMWRADQIPVLGETLIPDEVAALRADLRLRLGKLPIDLRKVVKKVIVDDNTLTAGTTLTWDPDQLNKVDKIFIPFETEARERAQKVLNAWGGRGDLELRVKILELMGGETSLLTELTAVEADALIKGM